MSLTTPQACSRFFYGWVIVAACFALIAVGAGKFFSLGVFFNALREDFGWSRTATSYLSTQFIITYALSAFLLGRLTDHYGPRKMLAVAGILIGIGFGLISVAQSFWELCLYYGIAGFGTGAVWSIPVAAVQRWFIKRRGLALGIGITGVGAGALLFAPLTNTLIDSYGWRSAYVTYAVTFGLITLLCAWLMRATPEQVGLKPYGWEPADTSSTTTPVTSLEKAGSLTGMSTRQAIRTKAFLIVNLMFIFTVFPSMALLVHFVPYAVDSGMSEGQASAALGVMGVANTPGIFLGGVLSERFGWQKAFAYSNFGMAVAGVWLLFTQDAWMLYVFVIAFGAFWGARITQMAGIVGAFFGTVALAELTGITEAINSIAGAGAPLLAGFVFDVSGSYRIIFIVSIICAVASGVLSLSVRPPEWQVQEKAAREAVAPMTTEGR